jgi:uncharacterized protein YndB with AHSA1/START domain
MVITAEFKTSIANVWQLWADPRLLERWWGPPGFPATFEHHDLTPGGTITYFMSGRDGGDTFNGTWNVIEADAPTRLVVEDAIVEDDGTPSDGHSMTRMEIDIEAAGETTRMVLTTHFDSLEGMEQAIAMGVAEGMKACMSQIDALLAEVAAEGLGDCSQQKIWPSAPADDGPQRARPLHSCPHRPRRPNRYSARSSARSRSRVAGCWGCRRTDQIDLGLPPIAGWDIP